MKKYLVPLLLFFIVAIAGLLRFYNITSDPPGLYVDEVSIGLNAYDVLTTGKDQYAVSHPLFFAAYGEYKMPVYIYLVSGSMAIFGKDTFAIRFPSALLGTLTVFVVFFLTRELLRRSQSTKNYADSVGLLSAFLLAISPWHLQFSRAGFEATAALFFYCLSILLFLMFQNKKKFLLILFSGFSLAIAFYTYDGYKLLVPLSVVAGTVLLWREKKMRKSVIASGIFFLLLSLPLFVFTFTSGGLMRFSQTSAFSNTASMLWWQKYLTDIAIFVKNYVSYFSLTYLFRFGDQINRHQVQGFGLLYIWQLSFLLAGLYAFLKTPNKILKSFLLFLLIAEPIAPALTIPSPHALRFLYAVVPFTILTGLGIHQLVLQKKKWLMVLLAGLFLLGIFEFVFYMDYYYVHYPKDALIDWGGACKQVAEKIFSEYTNKAIVVDSHAGCVADYFAFYIPHIPITYVATTSAVLKGEKPTVLVTGDKPPVIKASYQGKVILPNLNQDTFATFWNL